MEHVRNKPLSLQEIEQITKYRNNLGLLQESGFLPFLQKINRFDMGVVLELERTLKEGRVRVRSFKFKITKEFVLQATCLSLIGEHWFKKVRLTKKHWQWFMVDKKIEVD